MQKGRRADRCSNIDPTSSIQAADFIADMLVELKRMAEGDRLYFLAYLLDLALEEARSASSVRHTSPA